MSSSHGKEKKFIKKPYYPGGKDALRAFVTKHRVYPEEAAQNKIKGVVRIRMTIDLKGNVIDTKLIKKVGYGCDEEAIRIVRLLKYKVPHTRKLKGKFHKNINIHFGPQAKRTQQEPQSTNYRYTITPSSHSKTPPQSNGYTYTIQLKKSNNS